MYQKIVRLIQDLLDRLPHLEAIVLVVLTIGTASTWGFIELADEVREGDTQSFDHWSVQILRDSNNRADPIGPPWVEEMGRDATALGGIAWLPLRHWSSPSFSASRQTPHDGVHARRHGSGAVMSVLLKNLFSRPRPSLVPHLSHVSSSSFPSGHSMLAAVVYLTLGSLLAAVMPNRKLQIYVLSVAVMLTLFVAQPACISACITQPTCWPAGLPGWSGAPVPACGPPPSIARKSRGYLTAEQVAVIARRWRHYFRLSN